MDNRNNENNETVVPSLVSKEIVELAVELLLKVINSKPKDQRPQRLDRNEFICLVVMLKTKPNDIRTIPQSFPVPHPLFPFDESQKICLIIGNGKEGLNAEVAENKIKEEGLPISKVFQCKKLMADCVTSEDRKKLRLSYDLFMVCKAALSMIPKSSGLAHPSNERNLVPVDLTHKQWRGELESACSLAIISFKNFRCVAKVARVSQTSKEIVENVVAVIDSLVSVIPEHWNDISCMWLQTLGSLECSLYKSFSKMPIGIKGVETESQIDGPEMNGEEEITGGLSTRKKTQLAEKAPATKRKKNLEGKTGSLNDQGVGDGVPKDDSPATSGFENNIESVDLQGGVVVNSVEASTKKKNTRRSKKTPVRFG